MLLAILLSGPLMATTPAQAVPVEPICKNPEIVLASRNRGQMGMRPLGDLPPARHILAVVRTVDGCVKPIVVNAQVGKR